MAGSALSAWFDVAGGTALKRGRAKPVPVGRRRGQDGCPPCGHRLRATPESHRGPFFTYTYIENLLYAHPMKRLQILIDEELDEALERQARNEGTSKAALIRRFVRDGIQALPPLESDPLWRMRGADDFEPADIDHVVYD